jgi:hypothetical protein
MGNTSVPKFIFRLSRFPVYRGSGLGRFYCTVNLISYIIENTARLHNSCYVPLLGEELDCHQSIMTQVKVLDFVVVDSQSSLLQ